MPADAGSPIRRPGAGILAPVVYLLLGYQLLAPEANAGSIVGVKTSLGDFYIEVDEVAAPVTAGNPLNYVRTGRYNNSFVHGASGGATIRGGGYVYNSCNTGPEPIPSDPPVPLEMTGLSNRSGTIAALHPSTEPDAATSQWLINIGNAPSLDTLNGGYAVFGKVLGDGLAVVSQIASANPVRLGFFEETPTINYLETNVDCQRFSRDNLVLMYMSVISNDRFAPTAHYDPATQTLSVNIDLGEDGFRQLDFDVDAQASQTSMTPRLASARILAEPVPNMATYNRISGRLVLPSIAVAGEIVYRNLEFDLLDSSDSKFILRTTD